MTGGIHHASNYDMSQICQRGFYYHPEVFSLQSVPKKVGSAFGGSTKAPEKKTLLLMKFTLSATIMFMLNSLTLPHCYMGTYI